MSPALPSALAYLRRYLGRLRYKTLIRAKILLVRISPVSGSVLALYLAHIGFFGFKVISSAETFSGKMRRRLLENIRKPNALMSVLSDKILARSLVSMAIGSKYLVPVHWIGVNPSEINIRKLPNNLIIKASHASGYCCRISGQKGFDDMNPVFQSWLKVNHFYNCCERWYSDIQPRLLVEDILDDGFPAGPLDYRFWCFNGKAAIIQIDNNEKSINSFYDRSWQKLSVRYRKNVPSPDFPVPAGLNEMLLVADILSSGFGFVRVDLYNIYGRIFFGEMTFAPLGGLLAFTPSSWDHRLGSLWSVVDDLNDESEWIEACRVALRRHC